MTYFAFFGTSHDAVLVLRGLYERGVSPAVIITAPDAPRGRGKKFAPPPVKVWANQHNIPTLQPHNPDDVRLELEKRRWDFFVVVSYGKILPERLFKIPAYGTLNAHFSLLPLYRGAAPVEAQILDGSAETGVTIILMDADIDHGPIAAQGAIPMPDPLPTAGVLAELLSAKTIPLLIHTMRGLASGAIAPRAQDHTKATRAKRVSKIDAEISFNDGALINFRKIQAFTPKPGAYFFAESGGKNTRVKITKADFKNEKLVIERVIPEGRREMVYADFLRSARSKTK